MGTAAPLFGPRLLWPNGRPSQQLRSSCFECVNVTHVVQTEDCSRHLDPSSGNDDVQSWYFLAERGGTTKERVAVAPLLTGYFINVARRRASVPRV